MHLGIEIGGTKLQLGVGAGDGSPLVALERLNVEPARGAVGILGQIEETGQKLLARFPIERIGYGFGGPINAATGRIVRSHQVEGWHDFPLAEWTTRTLGRPTLLGNDCDVAGLAEAKFGAGRGRRVVFFVTVGSGIGGGLIIDGRIHHGAGMAAAEIGHLRPACAAPTGPTRRSNRSPAAGESRRRRKPGSPIRSRRRCIRSATGFARADRNRFASI